MIYAVANLPYYYTTELRVYDDIENTDSDMDKRDQYTFCDTIL